MNIQYGDVEIKQYSKVTYLRCKLEESLSGEVTALKIKNNINGMLKFPYRKNRYLTPYLERLLCNAWYPNLNKKLQATHNKCIKYYLHLDIRSHIGMKDFEKIHCLPVSQRYNRYLCHAFELLKGTCALCFHDVYRQSGQNQANKRSSVLKLKHHLRNTRSGQEQFSYLTRIVWNSLPTELKLSNLLTNFKQKLKDNFFKKLKNMEQDIFAY